MNIKDIFLIIGFLSFTIVFLRHEMLLESFDPNSGDLLVLVVSTIAAIGFAIVFQIVSRDSLNALKSEKDSTQNKEE